MSKLEDFENYNYLVGISKISTDELTNDDIKEFIDVYIMFIKNNLELFEKTDFMLNGGINRVERLKKMKKTDTYYWNKIPFYFTKCINDLDRHFKK